MYILQLRLVFWVLPHVYRRRKERIEKKLSMADSATELIPRLLLVDLSTSTRREMRMEPSPRTFNLSSHGINSLPLSGIRLNQAALGSRRHCILNNYPIPNSKAMEN